jgi:hypothetical protein
MEKTALDEGNRNTVEYLKEVSVWVEVSKLYTNMAYFVHSNLWNSRNISGCG